MKKQLSNLFVALFILVSAIAIPSAASAVQESSYEYKEISHSYKSVAIGDEPMLSSSFTYSHEMLLQDANALSTDLAKASVSLAMAMYTQSQINSALEQMGYTQNDVQYYEKLHITDSHHVAFIISSTVVKDQNGNEKILYCVPIRGTGANSEWYSDFTIGETDDHYGFYAAATEVQNHLYSILHNDGYSAENTIIWLMGHSRGAAVSNIIAGELTRDGVYAKSSGVFCYTYACPTVSKNANTSYKNIYNFNNPGDLITTLPLESWGYKRYGQTVNLDMGHKSNFDQRFAAVTGAKYVGATTDDQWIGLLKSFFPTEADIHSLQATLVLHAAGWGLSGGFKGTADTRIDEVIMYVLADKLESPSVLDIIKTATSLSGLGKALENLNTALETDSNFVNMHRTEVDGMTDEEFAQFKAANLSSFNSLEKKIGYVITNSVEFIASLAYLNAGLDDADWLLETLSIATTLFFDADTMNPMDAISHGHTTGTYVLWINSMYYGYRGWYGSNTTAEGVSSVVTGIGKECFKNCTDLEQFAYSGKLKHIGSSAFSGCTSLNMDLNLGGELGYLGSSAFNGCSSIVGTADLSGALEAIKEKAFYNCSSLTEVIIPDSVERIGDYAFVGCTGIKKITLPISCSYDVDYQASFEKCNAIEELVYTAGNGTIFDVGDESKISGFFNYDARCVIYDSRSKLKHVTFEDGITVLPKYVLYGCSALTEVVLPTTLETVGDYAFYGCAETETKIPKNVTEIGSYAFAACKQLADIAFLGDAPVIADTAFNNVTADAIYNPTLNGWAESVLQNYGGKITWIPLAPAIALKYSDVALYLSEYEFGDSVLNEAILSEAYSNTPITWTSSDESVVRVENGKMVGVGEGEARVTAALDETNSASCNVTVTADISFLKLPKKTVRLDEEAFSGIAALQAVALNNGLQYIGSKAFADCSGLCIVNIPASVTEIADDAFDGCTNLRIYCPSNSEGERYAAESSFPYEIVVYE